jgi:hypothetical protein
VVKGFRKLTRTTLFLLTQLPCKGGNIYASVAGGLHERGRYAARKSVDWLCRMMTGLVAFQTCTHQKHNQRHSEKNQHKRPPRHHQRHSAATWKRRHKTRLKLTFRLTSLPMIIDAKASSLTKVFPEGAAFNTDTFPVTLDSGSTYCLSNKRLDFEGALTRVSLKIQGITESKGMSKWSGTVKWGEQDHNERNTHFPSTFSHPSHDSIKGANLTLQSQERKLLSEWKKVNYSW